MRQISASYNRDQREGPKNEFALMLTSAKAKAPTKDQGLLLASFVILGLVYWLGKAYKSAEYGFLAGA